MLLSAYRVTREYGGPEEGGWYYDFWEFLHVHAYGSPKSIIKPKDKPAEYYTPKGNLMVVGRGSVLGYAGDIVYVWERKRGSHTTTHIPRYC
jgi:hypothetical protein